MKRERYARQALLPWIGGAGQAKICDSRVGIAGVGALGCMSAALLARAGVKGLVIADRDLVEYSNLQRQILYTESHAERRLPKVEAAAEALLGIRGDLEIEKVDADLGAEEVKELFSKVQIVLDGTDNFETRFLLNDASVSSGKPWVYAGAVSAQAAVMAILPGLGPCLRCVFPEMPPPGSQPTCEIAGVIAPAPCIAASLQVSEALKILCGREDLVTGGFHQVDLENGRFGVTKFQRDEKCPCCAGGDFSFLSERGISKTHRVCGRNGIMILAPKGTRLSLEQLESRLSPIAPVYRNPYLIQTEWEGHPITVYQDGRALVQGVDDPARARALYSKYLGM